MSVESGSAAWGILSDVAMVLVAGAGVVVDVDADDDVVNLVNAAPIFSGIVGSF